ncbi:MAG TPA: PAS domain-containing sensor histidine kinase [Egicoccus sp.]|nr:PAS domain-containing sensor histidine kinase [Egicoccus sp.]HSK21694.1 PAS domain-containing sensor histidine kinase [Egicoccus sp.]
MQSKLAIEETVDGLFSAPHLPVVAYCCRGDDRWNCLSVSESLEAKFGISPLTWMADPHVWLQHVHPDDRERLVVDRVTAIDERRKLSTEYRLRTQDGRYRWVHDEAEFVPAADDDHPLMYGVITDITHRRHSDVILSELYEASRGQVTRLRNEVEERDLFARLLAHDLRMPLTAANAALAQARSSGAKGREALTRAQQAIDQANQLVSGVLELDRWSGERVLRVESTELLDVAKLATETIDFADRELVVDVPDAQATLDVLIVSRALANLVDNAVTHSPPGGTVRLRAYEQVAPHSVIFSVEDEGPGVPESIRDDIFRPFVSSRVDQGDSHGLGLTLVKRMALLHDGRVWFEELPNGGVAFHLLIPQV